MFGLEELAVYTLQFKDESSQFHSRWCVSTLCLPVVKGASNVLAGLVF